jgi:hypothetical protein
MKKFSNGSYSLFEAQQHHLHSSSKEKTGGRNGLFAAFFSLSIFADFSFLISE